MHRIDRDAGGGKKYCLLDRTQHHLFLIMILLVQAGQTAGGIVIAQCEMQLIVNGDGLKECRILSCPSKEYGLLFIQNGDLTQHEEESDNLDIVRSAITRHDKF